MEDNMANIENENLRLENSHELKNPDMNIGNVVMYLSSETTGFEIETEKDESGNFFQKSLARKEGPLPLNDEEKNNLKTAMIGESGWTGAGSAKEELDNLRSGEQNAHIYEFRRQKYINEGHKPKVGLRNIRRNGNKILFDTKPISFPVYSRFSKDTSTPEQLEFSENAATCMSVVTSDNKVLVQHRAETNELYGDMPGASIAGMFDGSFDRTPKNETEKPLKGRLSLITKDSVLKNIRNEAREEMGMNDNDYEPTMVGFCEEVKPIPHHEFLFTARTHLTSDQIKEQALHTTRARKKDLKPEDIEEKFEFIDATPEALYKLIAEVKCPLPPTHTAVFAATAYELMLTRDGKEAAEEFKKKLEAGIKQNYEAMDEIVKNYYSSNPANFNEIPERLLNKVNTAVSKYKERNLQATDDQIEAFKNNQLNALPKRNPNGYTPSYLPKEQGLPEFDDALKEKGLIG